MPLRPEHLQVAFRLYGMGISMAAVAFVMEKMVDKIKGLLLGMGETLVPIFAWH